MRTIIKNGKIATSSELFYSDILIVDGKVKTIDTNLNGDCDEFIDAKGKLVIPGGVDVHTHLNLHTGQAVSCDDFYSGTVAAACGGTTCIVDHMGFGPEGCSLKHQLKVYHEYAYKNAVIDYSFHGVIQHVNHNILSELDEMMSDEGITSFKIYMTYNHRINDRDAFLVLNRLEKSGGVTAVHAENHELVNHFRNFFIQEGKTSPIYHALSRPEECEEEAVKRIISIANLAGNARLYVVHLTTEAALKHVEAARNSGQRIYAETCPQYLLLNEEKYYEENCGGLKYVMSPPLRSRRNCEALWRGIKNGSVQVIATDHCPFPFDTDKQKGRDDFTKCPNGAPGIEERLPLIFSEGVVKGRISVNRFVEVCCTNPAKIFGLYPEKGTIMPGSDGDIVIIDPEISVALTKDMLHSRVDYTAYEGYKISGYPVATLSRGEIISRNNVFLGMKGRGNFIKRGRDSLDN